MFTRLFKQGIVYRKNSGGELGSGRPDRAGQRAGDRRPRLAQRRDGRKARDPAVVPEDHRLRAGTAGRPGHAAAAGRMRSRPCSATGSAAAKAWKSSSRVAGASEPLTRVHHAPGHPDGRDLSWRSPPNIRWRMQAARGNPELAAFIDECKQGGVSEAELETQEKKRHGHRPVRHPSGHRRAGAGLGRQFRADGLRHRRGDGGARPRPARLRIRAQVRLADQAGDRRCARRCRRTSAPDFAYDAERSGRTGTRDKTPRRA